MWKVRGAGATRGACCRLEQTRGLTLHSPAPWLCLCHLQVISSAPPTKPPNATIFCLELSKSQPCKGTSLPLLPSPPPPWLCTSQRVLF